MTSTAASSYANQKTFDLHGYSREDFFAATLHDIDVSKSDGLIAYRMEQLMKTGEVSFEVSHFRKDGSTLPLSVQARIGNWGGTNVVLSIASDIVSRSFYEVFKVKPEETVGHLIYDLGNKQWDIPKLRELLETILPEKTSFDNYEVEHDFSTIGRRTMLLNARSCQKNSVIPPFSTPSPARRMVTRISDIKGHCLKGRVNFP